MNTPTPNMNTAVSDRLASSMGMMLANPMLDRASIASRNYADEGAFSYVRPGLDSFTGGQAHWPVVWDAIADCLASISDNSGKTYMFTAPTPPGQPTTMQIKSAHRPAWRPQIANAASHAEIIAMLRLFGLDVVADRLVYLCSLADDDPDEPRVEIESLRAMALFIMSERHLLDPRIGITPDGLIQIEWRIPDNGVLAMVFLPSGLIRFAAVSGPYRPEIDRWSVYGTLPKDGTLSAVEPFTAGIRLL